MSMSLSFVVDAAVEFHLDHGAGDRVQGERVRGVLGHMQPLQNPAKCFAYLRQIPPLAFEELILSELKARGHAIKRSVRYSGDGGADGEWELNGRLWLVQAKRYASRAHLKVCALKGAQKYEP